MIASLTHNQVCRTVCPHDCPDTCSILATVEDGRVVRCDGDPGHPFTQGYLCHKVARYPERIYSPLRVLHPMRRIGAKGEGRFARVTWDEALDEIADRFRRIAAEHGGEAILPFSYGGTLGIVQRNAGHAFFHRLGASRLKRTICDTAGEVAWRYTVGACLGTDPESIVHSDFIVVWGMNILHTNLHIMPFIKAAQAKGARLIVIDPYRNRTAKRADVHLMIRPGTDGALALGAMHVLVAEDLIDAGYIARHTSGFEELRRVLPDYPPDRVSRITGLARGEIEGFARGYGRARAPFIRVGIGLGRHTNGGMATRAIACLPGLVGAYAKPGGGAVWETFEAFPLDLAKVRGEDLLARPTREINMVQLGDALTGLKDPPIEAIYVYHANPAANVPDQGRVLAGLRREDLFTVVHEQMHTDTVDYADIVLPATTSFEHTDLYRSYGHYYLQLAQPVIPPQGEAKSNLEVFQLLAPRMGFGDPIFRKSVEEIVRDALDSDHPFLSGITYEALADGDPIRVNIPRHRSPFHDGFPTPSGKLEFFSARMKADGLDPLPAYVPSVEGHENRTAEFPLLLMTPPSKDLLNTSFGGVERLRVAEGKPRLKINPANATERGITHGGLARVYNGRGDCILCAEVTMDVPAGLLVAESIWWNKQHPGGRGINQLTSQRLTDMGECSTLHESLVNVERVEEGQGPGARGGGGAVHDPIR